MKNLSGNIEEDEFVDFIDNVLINLNKTEKIMNDFFHFPVFSKLTKSLKIDDQNKKNSSILLNNQKNNRTKSQTIFHHFLNIKTEKNDFENVNNFVKNEIKPIIDDFSSPELKIDKKTKTKINFQEQIKSKINQNEKLSKILNGFDKIFKKESNSSKLVLTKKASEITQEVHYSEKNPIASSNMSPLFSQLSKNRRINSEKLLNCEFKVKNSPIKKTQKETMSYRRNVKRQSIDLKEVKTCKTNQFNSFNQKTLTDTHINMNFKKNLQTSKGSELQNVYKKSNKSLKSKLIAQFSNFFSINSKCSEDLSTKKVIYDKILSQKLQEEKLVKMKKIYEEELKKIGDFMQKKEFSKVKKSTCFETDYLCAKNSKGFENSMSIEIRKAMKKLSIFNN